MCRSMVDIQSSTAEIRQEKKERKKEEERRWKPQGKNIVVCPITYGDHKYAKDSLWAENQPNPFSLFDRTPAYDNQAPE